MATLRPCSRCGSHVRSSEASCPFCDAPLPGPRVGATMVVLAGLALAGCEKKGGGPVPPPEPDYGVAVTDTAGGDDEGGMPADEGGMPADEGGMPADEGGVDEPEYGVPDTAGMEAEYGVPEAG